MYHRYSTYALYALALAGAWTILHEQPSWSVFLTGVAVSVLVLVFTARVLRPDPPLSLHRLPVRILIRYLFTLVFQIYHSGFIAIGKIIRRDEAIRIERFETLLSDELSKVMLANAVTLTPGTVTIELEGQSLLVLSFAPDSTSKRSKSQTSIRKIERILLGKFPKEVKP